MIVTILFMIITINRAFDWSDVILLGERLAQRHPNSVTSNYQMGYVYSKAYEETHNPVFANNAKKALQKAESLSEGDMKSAIALIHVRAMLGEAEDQVLIKKIAKDFKYGKVDVSEVISLRQYVNCQIEAICSNNKRVIHTLFSSLLANESVQGRLRDDVLYIYSTYLATTPESSAEALTIMQDIVSRNPDTLEYKIKLISLLLSSGRADEAGSLMDTLTKRYGIQWNLVKNNK